MQTLVSTPQFWLVCLITLNERIHYKILVFFYGNPDNTFTHIHKRISSFLWDNWHYETYLRSLISAFVFRCHFRILTSTLHIRHQCHRISLVYVFSYFHKCLLYHTCSLYETFAYENLFLSNEESIIKYSFQRCLNYFDKSVFFNSSKVASYHNSEADF
jgi:hypothetical protein